MSKERDILKSLLLKEELELLNTIKQKLLSEEQFTAEVSNVLAAALKRAQLKDKSIDQALAKPIKKGVTKAFSDSKQSIVDALLPIMGHLIRKTVTNSIKQFVSDINRTLELGFSTKALKWRWQAYKAGIPFAQMVFQKTIRYQVKELFLINRENGLLIEYAGSDDLLKDNNAISAMLTAIQDFVGDSLNESGADLLSIEIEGKLIIISSGPTAYVASVVLGSPTERLKQKLQQLIENIHAEFSALLSDESQYGEIADLNDFLRTNLITKSIDPESKTINWKPWAFIIIATLSAFYYWSYQKNMRYKEVVSLSKSIDGFFLQAVKQTDEGYVVTGLLDPLADISPLEKLNVKLLTKAYISVDEAMVDKRVQQVMLSYPKSKAKVSGNTVILTGDVSPTEAIALLENIQKVTGVEHVNKQLKVNSAEKISAFLKNYPSLKQSLFDLNNNSLKVLGSVTQDVLTNFELDLKHEFNGLLLDTASVKILESNDVLINQINTFVINIPNLKQQSKIKLDLLVIIKNLQSLIYRGIKIRATIIGQSDCFGHKSNQYSLMRAQAVKNMLKNEGIDNIVLSTKIVSCKSFNSSSNPSLLNVAFKVEQLK